MSSKLIAMEVMERNEVEEEEMEEENFTRVAELWGAKKEELMTSLLSWFGFSLKLNSYWWIWDKIQIHLSLSLGDPG